MTKLMSIDTSELLSKIEKVLKQEKMIGREDYIILNLLADGSGQLLSRNLVRGIIKDYRLTEFDSLSIFYSWSEKIIGKEV